MSENIKRITFCAEPEDVRILEKFRQALGGASASAVIRLALRKLDGPAAPEQRHERIVQDAQRYVAAAKNPVLITPRNAEE